MLDRLANWLALKSNLPDDDKEVIEYALTILATTLGNIISLVIIAWLMNTGKEILVIVLPAVTLRIWSGGAHATAPCRCIIFGTIVFAFLAWFVKLYANVLQTAIPIYLLIAFIIIYLYAPLPAPNKPLKSQQHSKKLRKRSIMTLIFWITLTLIMWFIEMPAWITVGLAIGLLWQALTLLPLIYKIISRYI